MRPIIVKLARMLTDCMDAKMGLVRMDESRWEYKMLDALLTDEQAELMLKMGRRKPTTAAELAKKTGGEEAKIQALLDELADIGLVEYNRHNADRHRQYVVPIFVVGSAENLMLNKPLLEKHPEIAEFFYQMAEEPLKLISHMVPPGGSASAYRAVVDRDAFATVYPECFPIKKKDPASQIEEGHEAARSIHRSLHPGHSLTLARDPRSFRAFRRDDVVLPIEKLKTHDCLSCGVSYVDPNRCIGCGICTTRCIFDAIRLERSHPEFANYCSADDTVKKVVLNGARRAGRIAIRSLTKREN